MPERRAWRGPPLVATAPRPRHRPRPTQVFCCGLRRACYRPALRWPDTRRVTALAGVAELVDARDLGSRVARRGGSSPSARTTSAVGNGLADPRADAAGPLRRPSGRRRPPVPRAPIDHAATPARGLVRAGACGLARDDHTDFESDDDAGDRDTLRGAEAHVSGVPRRERARGSPEHRTLGHEGQGPAQGLPPRQGAGRAPAQGLRPLGDGRRRAERRQRGQPEDRDRQRPEARPGAADRIPVRPVGGREGARRQGRPLVQGGARSAAELRARRPLRRQPDEARRHTLRQGGGRGAGAHGRPEPSVHRA